MNIMNIINAIEKFIVERGFTLMLCGLVTAIAGVSLNLYVQYNPAYFFGLPWVLSLSVVLAIAGFAVYIIGRVLLAIQRRRARRRKTEE